MNTAVRVLNELRDLPVPVDLTVVGPAHLDEEARVPGVVREALRGGGSLSPSDRTAIARRWLRWADEDVALAEPTAAARDVVPVRGTPSSYAPGS